MKRRLLRATQKVALYSSRYSKRHVDPAIETDKRAPSFLWPTRVSNDVELAEKNVQLLSPESHTAELRCPSSAIGKRHMHVYKRRARRERIIFIFSLLLLLSPFFYLSAFLHCTVNHCSVFLLSS